MVDQVYTNTSSTNLLRKYVQNSDGGQISYAKTPVQEGQDKFEISAPASNDDGTKEDISKKKGHRKRNLAVAVGSSTLLVGGGMLVLMRGLPKNTEKYLQSLKKFLEKKLEKSSTSGSDGWSTFWEKSIRQVDSTIEKTQSINNFTSLKDVLFKNIMDRNKYTAKIHKGISDYYELIARRTVLKSYKKTNKSFDKMYEAFDSFDERLLRHNPDEIINYNGKNYTKRELIELARQHRQKVKTAVGDFTSQSELDKRYQYIKDATKDLYNKFWDESFKEFWTKKDGFKNNKFRRKEMWQTCIYDEKIKGNKKSLSEDVSKVRNIISYTDKDRTKLISNHIKVLKNMVSPSDKDGLNIIKKLEWFMDNPEGLSANRETLIRELNALKERPFEEGLSEAVEESQIKLRETSIKSITALLDNQNVGKLQEMLAIYRKIAPYELEKSKAELSVRKAVSSFDKSLGTETVEFFDKVRDLQMGAAPTDVLTILSSAGMIAYGLGDAEDKDEKISVLLTAGIPIFGTIGTTVVCTTKLISGGLSMLFSLGVGGIFKLVCDGMDAHRLAAKEKNHTNDEVA